MSDLGGKNLGPYTNLEKIGQGGMGAVYKGYQPSMDRTVAIKVLPADIAKEETFVKRFEREARVIAKLEHARILPVHNFGREGNTIYLVMRYLEGGTLRQHIEQVGAMPLDVTARIISQVCEGLAHAHKNGIVHRDISANNIMFDTTGDAYITDFGLAKLTQSSAQLTGSGGLISTPAYVSPEQALGEEVDHRCDIYSLGIVLYHMLVGEVPYTGDTPMVVVVKHINDPLPDPREKRPDLPDSVAAVVMKATAKNPDARYQSAQEFAHALIAAIRKPGTGAESERTRVPPGDVRIRVMGNPIEFDTLAVCGAQG